MAKQTASATQKKFVPAFELKRLKLQCDAISASNVFCFDDNLKIRKLGSKAKRLYDENIGDALELIEDRIRAIQGQQAAELRQKHTVEEMKILVENNQKDQELNKTKIELEFDVIEIDKPEEDGWEKNFPEVKHIGYETQVFPIEPYDALLTLIEKGYINIK